MTYPGGKNGNGVIHAVGRQIPPHRARIEAFSGSAPLSRLVKLPELNVIIDADARACAAAASVPALSAAKIIHGDALKWLRGTFPKQLTMPGISASETARWSTVKIEARTFHPREVLLYCDPPYLLSTRSYQRDLYACEFKTEEEHAALLELLVGLPCLVMLSGYRSALYDRMLAEWRRVDFPAMTHRGKRTESLWCNFPEPKRLHDSRYWGTGYRARLAFSRMKKRFVARVAKMDPPKRWALFETLEEALGISASVPALRPGVTFPGKKADVASRPLVLSTFTGAGLMDRGFTQAGFLCVSAGDALTGQRIEEFHAAPGHFAGVIGGPPCQKDSNANRTNRDPEAGLVLKREFFRVVREADCDWFLMEGVNGLPLAAVTALVPAGYKIQRLHLNARELGFAQNRERWYVFGFKAGQPLVIPYVSPGGRNGIEESRCVMASESRAGIKARPLAKRAELQGLPPSFEFAPGLSLHMKGLLIGNGNHVGVARVVAQAIRDRGDTPRRVCVCECGREVPASRVHGTTACRKRMQRRRDAAPTILQGPDTAELLIFPGVQDEALESAALRGERAGRAGVR